MLPRIRAMVATLFAWSIWHPDAIDPDEFKYRKLKRFWLPLFDLIAIGAGLWATAYGSPILHRLFAEDVVDILGITLTVVATICLLGVSFPRLWRLEIFGKTSLIALLAGYALAIVFFRNNPDPEAGFVVFILALGIPLPMFRLDLLGEEIKERREDSA